jgi:hypothetical protein
LKVGEFNEDFKAERFAIKTIPMLIHLELIEKDTLVTRKILETSKKHATKQKTSQN